MITQALHLNPLYTGGLLHYHMLDESICHFRDVGFLSFYGFPGKNELIHLCQVDSSILINWTSLFIILGVTSFIFIILSFL